MADTESALYEPGEQRPPDTEQRCAQPRLEKELCEIRAQKGEQSPRHHHLLFEEQGRIEKQVHLLHFPQEVVFKHRQQHKNSQQRQCPGNVRSTSAQYRLDFHWHGIRQPQAKRPARVKEHTAKVGKKSDTTPTFDKKTSHIAQIHPSHARLERYLPCPLQCLNGCGL